MTTAPNYSRTVTTAREYYNSEDADNFYFLIWGGEDIHIGLYESDEDVIAEASRKTVQHMASKLQVTPQQRVLDIGSGYGGAARAITKKFDCRVAALNLSEVENERNRQKNQEIGLDQKIEVIDGSFESIPFEDESFDVVWSQDAILHSGNRQQVIREVARVLKPGGEFIFTDPMQSDSCPEGVLQPILDRIHLDSLGSPAFYKNVCGQQGLEFVDFEDLTPQLVNHYSAVLKETTRQEQKLADKISPEYVERMKKGLQHWIDGGKQGYLAWGILHFKKS